MKIFSFFISFSLFSVAMELFCVGISQRENRSAAVFSNLDRGAGTLMGEGGTLDGMFSISDGFVSGKWMPFASLPVLNPTQ